MISFKVDSSQLEALDNICGLLGVSRNKFLNSCVSFVNSCVNLQIDVALGQKKSLDSIPFMSDFI